MFDGYGLGGFTKDIKLSPEEVEKIKSNLIEWDGEFYPKIFEWKNPEDLYRACVKQQLEIERLNNIINECAEDILKELEENHHLSCGVALGIRQKLLDYKELKGNDK